MSPRMTVFVITALVLLSPTRAVAFQCDTHTQFGIPSPADQLLCRQGYAAGYSYEHRSPEWVIYEITAEEVANSCSSDPGFREDNDIPEAFRSTNNDYKNSGYDRGHMAPRAAVDFNCASETESVLYSNASPQDPGLNQVGWKKLESFVRDWVAERTKLFIVTGAVFHSKKRIRDRVTIPSHYYKVIYDPAQKQSISFLYPNEPLARYNVHTGITTISHIDALSDQNIGRMFEVDTEHDGMNF